MKDPYQILGIAKTASQDEIKNAYRNLAKKFHPDLNPGDKEREAKFKEIAHAYELIGDPEMRGKFDRGETPEQQQAQAEEWARQQQQYRGRAGRGGPFYSETQGDGSRYSHSFDQGMGEDFFENLFRQSRGGGGRGASYPMPGEDQLYRMDVDFRDAVLGGEREITLPSGKKLQVKIPPGIDSGSRLRFRGQGGPGMNGGPAGDAYVEIQVRPREGFRRVGKDIETEVPISLMEAVLGGEIQVPTIDGAVMLKVPPGVSSGAKLRVRGKGVAKPGEERGDQIVALKIVLPKKVDPDLQAAVREWQGKFSYNPRSEA